MRGLAAIAPGIDVLRKELESNNVPQGQEAQYFQSKGRPLDPNLAFLVQMNKQERSQQPQQQQVMQSVLQDKIRAAMQQAQPQPLPPPAAMQAQAQQGQQPRPPMQDQPQQAGIPSLPFANQGYARGGVVVFDEGGDDGLDNYDFMGGDNTDAVYGAMTPEESQRTGEADAATRLLGGPMSQIALRQYQDISPEKLKAADKEVIRLDREEAARRDKALEDLAKNKRRDQLMGIAAAAFGSMGKHSDPWAAIGDVGSHAAESTMKVDSLYRAAEEKAKDAKYQAQRATALREAGYVKDAAAMKQKALASAVTAKHYEDEAEARKATAKAADARAMGSGDPAAQFFRQRNANMSALASLDPASEDAKRLKRTIDQNDLYFKQHPELFQPRQQVATITGQYGIEKQRVANEGKLDVAKITADAKKSPQNAKVAVDAFNARINLLKSRLPYDVLSGAVKPDKDQKDVLDEITDIQEGLKRINTPDAGKVVPPPATPAAPGAPSAASFYTPPKK